MVQPGSIMLVHFVEQQLEGWTFERKYWPLHITLVPWFTANDDEAVIRSLDRVAEKAAPLQLKVGDVELFGVDKDVPVNVIYNDNAVMELHEKLLDTLAEADSSYHDQMFIGSQYVAHITRRECDGRHSNEGEEIHVNDFHLVRLIDDTTCRVEQQFRLSES